MTIEIFSESELPAGFAYPPLFLRVVDLGLVDFSAWKVLSGSELRDVRKGLGRRYRKSSYLPFATRIDNDDVACWIPGGSGEIVIVHDFASPGWEVDETLPDFASWLRRAVEDLIDYES